ncbi:MAG: uroporphyrinogen-III synthase [Myxococcota bacterium]|nr:uroporphyrinogen-III synthase [Myxococcota bacterium]
MVKINPIPELSTEIIWNTRPPSPTGHDDHLLEQTHATIISQPVIEFTGIKEPDMSAIEKIQASSSNLDGIIFSSFRAAQFFENALNRKTKIKALLDSKPTIFTFPSKKIAEHCRKFNLPISISDSANACALGEHIVGFFKGQLRNKIFLFPSSTEARKHLPTRLAKQEAKVFSFPLYRPAPLPKPKDTETLKRSTWILLWSPSAIRALDQWNLKLSAQKLACIGDTTSKEAKRLGYTVSAVAREPSINGLIKAIKDFQNRQSPT